MLKKLKEILFPFTKAVIEEKKPKTKKKTSTKKASSKKD